MLQRKKQRQIQRKWPATFCVAQRRSERAHPCKNIIFSDQTMSVCWNENTKMEKNKYKDNDQQRSAYHKDGAQSVHPGASIVLLDFAGQWQRQRQTQRKYENNDLRYTASHKKGERKPTQTHMHYASIVFSNQTVFLNCNYKYKDPRI